MSSITSAINSVSLPNQAKAISNNRIPASGTPTNNIVNSSTDLSKGFDRLTASVDIDPQFAKEMAEAFAFTPDKLLVNLNGVPPLNDVNAWQAWNNQSTEFDKAAEEVTSQRSDIFDTMKANGSSDSDIFKAILSFNKSLPTDYQIKSGFLKLDTYA